MRVSIFPRCDIQMYFIGENLMDVAFLQEPAERCRSLAEKADEFTLRRLLDLAKKPTPDCEVVLCHPLHRDADRLTAAPGRAYAPDRRGSDAIAALKAPQPWPAANFSQICDHAHFWSLLRV
jgi:hypothetical protein